MNKHPLANTARRSALRTVFATGALATTAFIAAAWQASPAIAAGEDAKPAVQPAASPAIEAKLFVAPYQDRIRGDGGLALDNLRLRILGAAGEMGPQGVVEDRICIDVFDPARAFSPAVINASREKAIELAATLELAAGGPLAAAFERANNARGMTVMFGTGPYARTGFGSIDLPHDVTFFVQEAYHGLDDEQRPVIDDRVVLAIADDSKSFWPLMLLLDRDIVKALATELRGAVTRRAV